MIGFCRITAAAALLLAAPAAKSALPTAATPAQAQASPAPSAAPTAAAQTPPSKARRATSVLASLATNSGRLAGRADAALTANVPTDTFALRTLFWLSELIVLSLVFVPVCRFYCVGWRLRRAEIINRISHNNLYYIGRFWSNTDLLQNTDVSKDNEIFLHIYNRISGRHLYHIPAALLAVTLFIFGGLVITTGLRVGMEGYIDLYQRYKSNEGGAFADPIIHLPLRDIDSAFWPFPPITLTFATLAAVAGAYLYGAQVIIRGYRSRTLLSTDLLWGSFRLIIAIPLGMSVGVIGDGAFAPLIGFALGAFPMAEINRILRGLLERLLFSKQPGNSDVLLKMVGVTPEISAQLHEEGIDCPQQLADTDPVSLTIRTGLPFDFVVNLLAQSQVWSYLGATTARLARFGYGDARSIKRLLDCRNSGKAQAQIAALAKAVRIDERILESMFKAIASDEYTNFLVAMSHVDAGEGSKQHAESSSRQGELERRDAGRPLTERPAVRLA